ncbi:MAG TPA: hypothetical protein VN783_17095 [Thermoanaerobaculia bacterium]|nr:hypothetical protein [Thermoanaerobaculia bacterium]
MTTLTAPVIESAAPRLVASSWPERWAPPFNQQPFPWTRYASPALPGSWTAVGVGWNGDIVAQLGAQPTVPNPPYTWVDLLAGFVRDFKLGAAGWHDWVASVRTGPISRLQRGGVADVYAFLQVRGPGNFNSVDIQPVASNQTLSLLAGSSQFGGAILQPGQYQIRTGAYCVLQYAGSALPYAEFIGSVTSVTHYGPATSPALAASKLDRRIQERLASDEDLLLETAPPDDGSDFQLLPLES